MEGGVRKRAQAIPAVIGATGRAKRLPSGSRFGFLTVVRFAGKDKNNQGLHACVCDCGRELFVRTSSLTSGHNKSCGIGKCHWNWCGGKQTIGSEAWAKQKLARLAHNSRINGWAEPVGGHHRVLDLWTACGGLCACCGQNSDSTLHLDHCHTTGRMRGFICKSCNLGIGHAVEDASRLFSMAAWVASQPEKMAAASR
jgi:hypothetical protein